MYYASLKWVFKSKAKVPSTFVSHLNFPHYINDERERERVLPFVLFLSVV